MPTATRTATGRSLARASPALIALETFAREARLHPELVRRFVALGMIEPRGGTDAAPLFGAEDAPRLARAVRLRADLGLNYAGAVLACELLVRIEELEGELRGGAAVSKRRHEVIAWTRTG